jgi:hypothetical protein
LIKIVTVPLAESKILLRVQNLGDIFDGALSKQVNLTMVVEGMWKSAHSLDSEVG